ncbi:TldD/PmbA family protein [Sphingosinicella microcystinivorans]|uniref:Microcin-processing peptidase 1 n=1 Tax=Sphingosinicella microcystinivorans TaxID=335406 RepID=A0AAD1D4M9_SPHMI|nr:metallopeptidase TldD-related protein [Sphingosinicella microcystinivorans]RKS89169.1 microcin-processing peptidase 1 [Sphingosinicella microcystinivorans]BBE32926.1 modulator protein [Sphingosinicella microcystinivorans]
MLDPNAALDRLDHAIARAKALGADAADAIYFGDMSSSVHVRLGELEDIGRSEAEEIGIRVFIGQRSANVSSSDLSAAALAAAAERAVAMAREAPEDRYAGLAPAERLTKGPWPALDIDDGADIPVEALRARALAAEDAARAVEGVSNSQGASASTGRAVYALATSHGFAGAYSGSSYGVSASIIAGSGDAMQRDFAYHSARHDADLETPEAVGRLAGERAVSRLSPAKLATGAMPVVFDPRVAGSLLGHFAGAISGSAITRGTSFLKDSLGQEIFPRGLSIVDDPLRVRGLRSRPFDGEGLPTARTLLVDGGHLTGWLLDSASARQLGSSPSGHASRGVSGPPGVSTSNLYMEAGTQSRSALIADIRRGLLVTELIGQGVNVVTGDYSRGAAGFLIEDGEITSAVAEITVAGNLKSMFLNLTPADDLVFRYAVNAPTLRIEGMTVAGA